MVGRLARRFGGAAVARAPRSAHCDRRGRLPRLDALARDFAGRWNWFKSGPRADIAIEADRYARYGYPVSAANVRASRLHRMRAEAGEAAPVVHSTLSEDERWVKDVVLATWARESVARDW